MRASQARKIRTLLGEVLEAADRAISTGRTEDAETLLHAAYTIVYGANSRKICDRHFARRLGKSRDGYFAARPRLN
jgi:hypothetical protein